MTSLKDLLNITLVQMNSTDSVESNFQQIKTLLLESSGIFPSQLIVFPENSLFMNLERGGIVPGLNLTDSIFSKLRELCTHYQTGMLFTTPIQERGQVFNATVFVSSDSSPKILYKKIHLFDISLEDGRSFRESQQLASGKLPAIWNFHGWKMGLSICYDLRFAELYNFYARKEVDILLVPSAFLRVTGEKHWHTLLKARAIESQCYVLAPAQSGKHQSSQNKKEKRWTYGHSLAISPDGEIILDMKTEVPAFKTLCLNREEIKKVRRRLPMSQHRRLKFSVKSSKE